jgi:hypothetical protein
MNLISCSNCAVVMDADNLAFPENVNNEDGSIDAKKATWDGDDYVPFVNCPVCNNEVTQK